MTTSGQQPPELPTLGPSTTSNSGETTTSSDYSEKASNTAPAPAEDTNPPQQHGSTLPGNRDLSRTLRIPPARGPPATSVSASCHRTPHRQGKRWTGTATWIGSDRIALLTLVLVAAGVGLAGMGQHNAAIGNEKSDQSLDFTHYMGCLAHPEILGNTTRCKEVSERIPLTFQTSSWKGDEDKVQEKPYSQPTGKASPSPVMSIEGIQKSSWKGDQDQDQGKPYSQPTGNASFIGPGSWSRFR